MARSADIDFIVNVQFSQLNISRLGAVLQRHECIDDQVFTGIDCADGQSADMCALCDLSRIGVIFSRKLAGGSVQISDPM